jgi:hypothetical protein
MTTLHLGVIDMPYMEPNKGFQGRKPHHTHAEEYENVTTYEVAKDLEERYGIMQAFFRVYQTKIAEDVENSLKGALESLLSGAPKSSPYSAASSDIGAKFKNFLSSQEVEHVGLPNVPTLAAEMGIRHRYKDPRGKWVGKGKDRKFVYNPPRPSFIDTGLYQASFKAWFD